MKTFLISTFGLLLLLFNMRPAAAATTPHPACLGFEDLPPGTIYANGDNFTSHGRSLNVGPFITSAGPIITGTVSVINAVAVDEAKAGAWGLELLLTRANIGFTAPAPGLEGLTLRFGDYGGDLNLRINGVNQRFANFTDIDGQVMGGVTISVTHGLGNDAGNLTLDGAITEFVIGGEALYLDDLCPNSTVPLPAAVLHRYRIDQAAHPDARYNDGSTPLFYFRRGVGSGADKWLFWFKGGGSCYDTATCAGRGADKTGDAVWLRPGNRVLHVDNRADGIFNPDPARNPDFYNWNHVFLVYGSSDEWSGTTDATINGVQWYFHGHYIVNAFLDAAQDAAIIGAPTLLDASEVLLTGSSGGGHGLLNQVDRLAQRLANNIPNVRVSAIADAAVSPAPDAIRQAQLDAESAAAAAVWQPVVDASCLAAINSRAQCLDAARLVDDDYISTPLFVHKDQLDPLILKTMDLSPCNPADQPLIDAFGAEVRRILGEEAGAFSPRWGRHVILTSSRFYNRPIDGDSMAEIVGNWYTGNQPTQAIQQPDPAEADQPKRCPDLGDAPDSSNHYTLTNTAYVSPTVSGYFPTVHFVAAGDVPGPYHSDSTRVWLGDSTTVEDEADAGEDADEENNIVDGGLADTANHDDGDDGWLNPTTPFTHCQTTTLAVRVARALSPTVPSRLYLNVWFDGNRDGAWDDTVNCPDAVGDRPAETHAAEWIVRNFAVDTALIPVGGHLDISVTTALVLNAAPALDHWLRFTLSEQVLQPLTTTIPHDGRGPTDGYQVGETEDYLTPVSITVNPDGTFAPSAVVIRGGQIIRWTDLTTTDAIVQIGDPTQFSNADVCGITDNDLDHAFAGDDPNEFTGPIRKGVSGLFVLSEDEQGFRQVSATETCMKTTTPLTVTASDGTTYQLCPAEGATNEMLDTTWQNPDITGVILRLNWNSLQTDNDGDGVPEYHWADLDREMNRAVENGKLFTLDVSAGKGGTPPWIFTTYTGTIPGPVTPQFLQDWASEPIRPTNGCGFTMTLGSPTDTAYRDLYIAMLEALADHVASDSRWFQALAHVKLSGANLITSEARLPNRCYNEEPADDQLDTIVKRNGDRDDCICNTQVWANAGYTPEGLYEYYRVVGNALYNAFYQRKSLGYQLIQAGFPRVESRTNFLGDTLLDQANIPLLNPSGTMTDDIPGTLQTVMVLQQGREGRFANPFSTLTDLTAGKLFVPQHSGLGRLPADYDPTYDCSQSATVITATLQASFPITPGTAADPASPGCPNPWAVDQGTLHGQVMGFQTQNTAVITTPASLESTLWNLTINSNGVYLEFYEPIAWQIYHTLGTGATAPELDNQRWGLDPTTNPAPYSKNLHTWAAELHARRRQLVDPANPHLADPFPETYAHTFVRSVTTTENYYYINPATCAQTMEPERVGRITVVP